MWDKIRELKNDTNNPKYPIILKIEMFPTKYQKTEEFAEFFAQTALIIVYQQNLKY